MSSHSAEESPSAGAWPGPALGPDNVALGFLGRVPDPRRYGEPLDDPDEVGGIVVRMIPAGARVLDVGCGAGFMARRLRERVKATVVGIELEPARVAEARSQGVEVHQERLSDDLLARLGQFDAIAFLDVLEHVDDPLSMLVCARRALAPNGRIVVSVPNVAHWTVRWDLLKGRFEYEDCGIMDATHLRWFTATTVHKLAERAGLRVDEVAFTAGSDLAVYHRRRFRWMGRRPVKWLLRLMPRLFGCQIVLRCSLDATRSRTAGAAPCD